MPINVKIAGKKVLTGVIIPTENSFIRPMKNFLNEVAQLTLFTIHFFKELVRPPYEFNELLKQSYLIGYKSFPLVAITGFIMGLVLTIQSRPTLAEFCTNS